jgi:3-carboxy-cis,cis-muconate cycloisomerase
MNSLFNGLHAGGAIAEIFSGHSFVDRCLRFERALAAVQAGLGVIPEEAALEIERRALVENIDFALLSEKTSVVGLPVVGLVEQLVVLCRDDRGQYVHYGATTQDVMDCAVALQMTEALALIDTSLNAIASRLDDLALAHAETVQAGRTNQQHALPITFGFKAAVWAAGVRRQIERLDQLRPRAATGQLGGAVGTLASFGDLGQETRAQVLKKLGLREPAIAWHNMRDIPAEAVLFLSQLAATLGKIGRDVLLLSSTEFSEVAFAAGRGASSTMPQKNNPVAASSMVALSRMLFHAAPMMLDASLVENERSLDAWYIELHALPHCFSLAGSLLAQTHTMLAELTVQADRMSVNAAMTGSAIVSETLQMALAGHIGLNRAHELVSRAHRQSRVDKLPLADHIRAQLPAASGIGIPEELFEVAFHTRFGAREVAAVCKKAGD